MIAFAFAIVVALTALASIMLAANSSKERIGTVENFRLTFGRQGQQILTIDGKDYNVWLDYSNFDKVARGNVLRHFPSKVNIGGQTFLTTTIISVIAVENKKNKDAAHAEPGTEVPT